MILSLTSAACPQLNSVKQSCSSPLKDFVIHLFRFLMYQSKGGAQFISATFYSRGVAEAHILISCQFVHEVHHLQSKEEKKTH